MTAVHVPLPFGQGWTRREAQAFVADLRSRTVCAHCGAQPVDWHNPEHVELNRQHYRITAMAHDRRSREEILEEVARCTPLCRRCHMAEDGRLAAFARQASEMPKTKPAAPCVDCERPSKPTRRGRCSGCYDRWRRSQMTERERAAMRERARDRYHATNEAGQKIGLIERREYVARRRAQGVPA